MAHIDPLGISPFLTAAGAINKQKDEKSKADKVKKQSFFTSLKKAADEEQTEEKIISDSVLPPEIQGKNFDETLRFLVDTVYQAGDDLKRSPYTDVFMHYKKTLSQFMNFVVKNSYEIELYERRKGTKRQQLVQIHVINTKLDELAGEILYNQSNQLKILAKIDEINGILINFLS